MSWTPVPLASLDSGDRVGDIGRLQPLDFFLRKHDVEGRDRIGQVAGLGGADDGRGDRWLGKHPGQSDLRSRNPRSAATAATASTTLRSASMVCR